MVKDFIMQLFGKGKDASRRESRRFKANDPIYNSQFHYAANLIHTSKYNVVTFLPKNLFEQFQRLANFYFLVLMILQLIPAISSLTPATTMMPLFAVLSATALKDAIDDYRRHKSDKQVNSRPSRVIRQGKLADEKWHNVNVGDVLLLTSNTFVPADLLVLSSSESHGLCFVETAELDGETNLKPRQALPDTQKLEDKINLLSSFNGEIECEPPNQNLCTFNGKMVCNGISYAIDNDKILLRGCIVRNTKWVYGLVIFAGKDTKLMQNSGKAKFKRTSLDKFLNVLIVGIMIFLFSMCIICSILCCIWEWNTGRIFGDFMPWENHGVSNSDSGSVAFISFLTFFSYIIILNTVVPISLYVSVEVIRFWHSYWINWDIEMYHEESDTPACSRTTTLNEELGQIQYIFSDKTGTLTQNIMTFNKCSINGIYYGDLRDHKGNVVEIVPGKTQRVNFSGNRWFQPEFVFYDDKLKKDSNNGVKEVCEFWRLIALCHTVMPDLKENNTILEYQAQSPDEAALTNAARNFGFVFKARTPKTITIEVNGAEETHELLCTLDFNNVRKRMSVVTREPKNGTITLYCKGADTMVMQKVRLQDNKLKIETNIHLDQFAGTGLRTLCLAYKIIDPTWFENWIKRHKEATEIVGEGRGLALDDLYEEIESDMNLMGATAIEDKLQDGVPEAIANLSHANIKIWVLTGDKEETAINIGYSCRLLTEDMHEIFVMNEKEESSVLNKMDKIRDDMRKLQKDYEQPQKSHDPEDTTNGQVIFSSNQHPASRGNLTDDNQPQLSRFALVINGHSLTHALKNEQLLVQIGCECRAVICCRVTPLQKAMVVDLIKRHKKAVTLSIGDGANDVSMIKMAHIGVGISGQEGMQAVLASDFSIAQFRFLERLLLVHGRWSYYRMSKFLTYFFYKNFAFTLVHFWFSFFCGYSAQSLYDPIVIAVYNLIFTSMPVICMGIFDQDVNDTYSLRYPKLYMPGQFNLSFNMRIFVMSVMHGLISSLVLFFIPYGVLNDNLAPNGRDINDLDLLSFTIYSSLVVCVSGQIALDTAYWTFISHIFTWGSVVCYYLFVTVVYEVIPYNWFVKNQWGVVLRAVTLPQYWLSIMLCSTILLLPVVGIRFFWFVTNPTLADRLRIRQNMNKFKED